VAEPPISPSLLLNAYAAGVFPMSESRFDPEIFWVDPQRRGIFPIGAYKISRSLARRMRKGDLQISFDRAFDAVVMGCADRDETWINDMIADLYGQLHRLGHAHSVEVWLDGKLTGGVYGVVLGAAFFGESMFSRSTDASKVALAYLLDRVKVGGFRLFDTQFLTPHLHSLGAIEVSRAQYRDLLADAITQSADFNRAGGVPSAQEVIQRSGQTS
jgi:leucyl/phenylalanyl-tRNA---protein transferase